ncbi:hypothetical protein [Methylobacterium nonmethylotrophicum]|uniref:Uncharacterized protein n=1 Tax=Methylobacterium nonmethylotrophicum TaxID=1141884 RepID=A0A4Z0NBW7_9HYPH|nr:hypothetical protein [Methylobacterium nonmethylotrophicum]TGD91407.1 hypothetical protein EU555_35825 [Methylobacterium nonmethylotrophicum]
MADTLTFRPRPRPAPAVTFREQIEVAAQAALDTADKLIAILNEMDGDPDLEDGADDEPSLGAPEGHDSQVIWLRGGDRDLELITQEKRP